MAKPVVLTPEGLKKLEDELEYLKVTGRTEIAERIKIARGFGDLSENAEYDAAKDAQASMEERISTLEEMIKNAVYSYDQILFTLDGSKADYKETIHEFTSTGYSVLNIDGETSYGAESIKSLKNVVLFISIVFSIFSLLILFNYSLNNVKARKKEIGILRATGARGRDVLKIFVVEEGILATIVTILSLIIVVVASTYINNSLGNLDIGIQLIVFNFVDILTIALLIYLIYGFSTLLPVMSVVNMKPIDAIRKN